jgi:cytochrome c-type biogenesis protein CcmH/NrfF
MFYLLWLLQVLVVVPLAWLLMTCYYERQIRLQVKKLKAEQNAKRQEPPNGPNVPEEPR